MVRRYGRPVVVACRTAVERCRTGLSGLPPRVMLSTHSMCRCQPTYCSPGSLYYAYDSATPVMQLITRCPNLPIGVVGPPCWAGLTSDLLEPAPLVNRLFPAAPNPFNPATNLRFDLAAAGQAELVVYDVRGRKVIELLGRQKLDPGPHVVEWRGVDRRGRRVASGVYYAELRLAGQRVGDAQKLVMVK